MFSKTTLKNGLTLITIPLPHLDSITTLVAVGAGSRYEVKANSGISHFLEHMFFKGSKKYPSTEVISSLIDGIGAVNNAATSEEFTYYWVKSASKHVELASDILSSMLKETLMDQEEIDREKGVIAEEIRMYKDSPGRLIWDLYKNLQFGDQPLGWDIAGNEKVINSLVREDFIKYMESLYSPKNMALVFAGNVPKNINEIAEKYFSDLPKNSEHKFTPYKKQKQTKPKIDVFFKQSDQANVVLGVETFDRYSPKRYAARVLSAILGEGMSSRLFMQVRERRGLAYHVSADHEPFVDTGFFAIFAGLKLEKVEEGLKIILDELDKIKQEKVQEVELKKAKDMIRGRLAIRQESTNFLAEYFGIEFILDREIETFDDYLKGIDTVTAEDIQKLAKELFQKDQFNLQIIAPLKSTKQFEKLLA
jgi:predicted Zn-dependent peptidase